MHTQGNPCFTMVIEIHFRKKTHLVLWIQDPLEKYAVFQPDLEHQTIETHPYYKKYHRYQRQIRPKIVGFHL